MKHITYQPYHFWVQGIVLSIIVLKNLHLISALMTFMIYFNQKDHIIEILVIVNKGMIVYTFILMKKKEYQIGFILENTHTHKKYERVFNISETNKNEHDKNFLQNNKTTTFKLETHNLFKLLNNLNNNFVELEINNPHITFISTHNEITTTNTLNDAIITYDNPQKQKYKIKSNIPIEYLNISKMNLIIIPTIKMHIINNNIIVFKCKLNSLCVICFYYDSENK